MMISTPLGAAAFVLRRLSVPAIVLLSAMAGPAGAQDIPAIGQVPAAAGARSADPVAAAITGLAEQGRVTRTVTLRELGFDRPDTLASIDARREVYVPVPAGIPIEDATVDLDARYLRAFPGRSTLLVSLDGYPVSSRAFTKEGGDASLSIGVDGGPRETGFLRLGIAWASQLTGDVCQDERPTGNVLTLDPDTRVRYSFDPANVTDIATAWTALPARPVILVSGRSLDEGAYDAAWRLGVALTRAGKPPSFAALPSRGDSVDLSKVSVPAALRAIPAYSALSGGGDHVLASDAEVGALLTLGAGTPRADVAVTDTALTTAMKVALDALAAEVAVHAPAASQALADWRAGASGSLATAGGAGTIRVARLGAAPVIAVAPEAGAEAAALFGQLWRRIVLTRSVVARVADPPLGDADILPISDLGGTPGPVDVLGRADWTATFGLGSIARTGRVPTELAIDVAAAPGATATAPVATVFLNDVLLGARMLTADGRPERITARIPSYALAASNVLRVTFQRQPGGEACRETPQAYPAAVLPTSHVRLGTVSVANDFVGMIARYASGADVIVPESALAGATTSLPTLTMLAEAVGIPPDAASLTVTTAAKPATPGRAFFDFGADLTDVPRDRRNEAGRLVLGVDGGRPIVDISGLDDIGVVKVVEAGDVVGVSYDTVGGHAPSFDKPLRLGRGDIAVVGASGVLAEINREKGTDVSAAEGGEATEPSSERDAWLPAELHQMLRALPAEGRGVGWAVPLATVGVLLFLVLLIRAAAVRRRARKTQD